MIYRRIVVPVDFSPASEAAWRHAQAIAGPDATITAVNIVTAPYPDVAYANIGAAVREQRTENEQRMQQLIAKTTSGARLAQRVVSGQVPGGILDTVRELHADLVVAGVHAHHGLEHLLRGSVVEALVRHAPCDVLVVKTAAED